MVNNSHKQKKVTPSAVQMAHTKDGFSKTPSEDTCFPPGGEGARRGGHQQNTRCGFQRIWFIAILSQPS